MTLSTSEVAACCSSASCSSRLSRATVPLSPPTFTARKAFDAFRRFSVAALEGRAFTVLPPALERRRIAHPTAQNADFQSAITAGICGRRNGVWIKLHRTNSDPAMSALGHKRTLECILVMSALPPKADIRTQSRNVRFVPKADIVQCGEKHRYSQLTSVQPSAAFTRSRVSGSSRMRLPVALAKAFTIA